MPILKAMRPLDPTVDETIACSPRAPSVARRVLEQAATDLDVDLLHDAQLLVSEVVTNSIKHSGSDDPIRLRVWARNDGLKVEVADGGLGFNTAPPADPGEGEGGRGLLILESLADRWGTSCDMRARVWFELTARA